MVGIFFVAFVAILCFGSKIASTISFIDSLFELLYWFVNMFLVL